MPLFGQAPTESLVQIGLTDAEHTYNSGFTFNHNEAIAMNASGQVVGLAYRYNNTASQSGQSVWIADTTGTTTRLGYVDATHTSGNLQQSEVLTLNAAGQSIGVSYRYDTLLAGRTAWLGDASGSLIRLGYTSAGYVRTDSYQMSRPIALNDAGQVIGVSARFNGAADRGTSAWLYTGGSLVAVGLADEDHTRQGDGSSDSTTRITPVALSSTGYVVGSSERFTASFEYAAVGSGGQHLGGERSGRHAHDRIDRRGLHQRRASAELCLRRECRRAVRRRVAALSLRR